MKTKKKKPETDAVEILSKGKLNVPPEWIEEFLSQEEIAKGYEDEWLGQRILPDGRIYEQILKSKK